MVGCKTPGRTYPIGSRCDAHSPATLLGRTVPIPDPALTLNGLRAAAGIAFTHLPATSALNDQRAIASGKRRSNLTDYRAAQAAEAERKAAR